MSTGSIGEKGKRKRERIGHSKPQPNSGLLKLGGLSPRNVISTEPRLSYDTEKLINWYLKLQRSIEEKF